MAALHAYLEEESQTIGLEGARPGRAWKRAAWQTTTDFQSWRNLSWKGRN